LDDYNKALELDPNDAYFYFNRGLIYQLQNDPTKAVADFQKVLQIGEDADLLKNAQTKLDELGAK
jgi:tetratricopeptide (TPR) repeat protein